MVAGSSGAAAVAAVLGVAALVVGAFVDPRRLFSAYLAAYCYVVSIALGALIFLMICHAMGAGWPTLLRRLTEAMVGTLPLLGAALRPPPPRPPRPLSLAPIGEHRRSRTSGISSPSRPRI